MNTNIDRKYISPRRSLFLFNLFLIVALVLTGCGSGVATTPAATNAPTSPTATNIPASPTATNAPIAQPITLHLMQYKPEITTQVNAMAAEYHNEFPNVTIETEILQQDYLPVLKSRINAGSIPDIFMTSGYTQNQVFQDFAYDFSKDPILDSIPTGALGAAKWNGGIYGIPVIVEAWGIIYNKDIFSQAGITTKPTNLVELESACKAITAKGFLCFANGFKDGWILAHILTKYYAVQAAAAGDAYQYAQSITSKKTDFTQMEKVKPIFDFLDLAIKYGNSNPLTTDVNGQVSLFGQGKAAMMTNGTWEESAIIQVNPNIKIGFLPVPNVDSADAKLLVDGNVLYALNKNSKNLEAAKDWLKWLVTSKYGEKFIVDDCGFIPTVKGWHLPPTMLAQDVESYLQSGNSLSALHGWWPDGYFDASGAILQTYINGSRTRDQILQDLNQLWYKLAPQQ
jgi:raffinose/stachyose/melibiose transport system substrate-binding protein